VLVLEVSEPVIPKKEINLKQSYFSNRIRWQGVMEKWLFCLYRTRERQIPVCLEACPNGVRVFGNLLDPESEIHTVLVFVGIWIKKGMALIIPASCRQCCTSGSSIAPNAAERNVMAGIWAGGL